MSLIDRVKNILLTPKTEWAVISNETETPHSLLMKYVIPLSLVPAIALFIGYGLIGVDLGLFKIGGMQWGAVMAINSFIASILGYYLCTYIIDALAPSFNSEKNIGKSAQLVAYSYTGSWVAGIFSILPALSILSILGLYGIYLFYLGIPVMKKTPEDKRIAYIIVSAIVMIVIGFVANMIISRIVYGLVGNPFLPGAGGTNDLRWR